MWGEHGAPGSFPLNDLPADAALGYVSAEGDLVNTLRLPVLGNGDGGAFTTAGDLHRFWLALLQGRIVSKETVEQMTRPRHNVPVDAHHRDADHGERARQQHRGRLAGHRSARRGG